MTLKAIQDLATEAGVKKKGTGWATCCPPDGKKPAIIRALLDVTNKVGTDSEKEISTKPLPPKAPRSTNPRNKTVKKTAKRRTTDPVRQKDSKSKLNLRDTFAAHHQSEGEHSAESSQDWRGILTEVSSH